MSGKIFSMIFNKLMEIGFNRTENLEKENLNSEAFTLIYALKIWNFDYLSIAQADFFLSGVVRIAAFI